MIEKSKKICMFVLNPCTNDARVLKEAATLGEAGYDVKIIAIISEDAPQFEEKKESFTIYRVQPRALLFYVKKILLMDNRKNGIAPKETVATSQSQVRISNGKENGLADSFQISLPPSYSFRKIVKDKMRDFLRKFHRGSTYISYWLKAKKLAVSFKADIYHAHDLNTILPAYLAAKKNRAKLVYDSHELYTERNTLIKESALSKWMIRKFEMFLIRKADAVITVNHSIAVELANLYKIPVPYVVMNCPDNRSAASNNLLRERIGLNGNKKIILYLGSITFNRGLEESITAMRQVYGGILVIMGYGKPAYIDSLHREIQQVGVEDRVCFIPAVPPHEVVSVSASADIGIVPIQNACKSYYYCSPNKLFESMMAGLPVAASNFPELRRVVEEANCGLLFDPSNPDEIARVLNTMIGDPILCDRMRESALSHARKYSWEEESKKLLSAYEPMFIP